MSGFQSQWLQSQQYWDDKLQKNQAQLGVVFFWGTTFQIFIQGRYVQTNCVYTEKIKSLKKALAQVFLSLHKNAGN